MPDIRAGKTVMQDDITSLISTRVPNSPTEITTQGTTHKHRTGDILAYVNHPNTPTQAINTPLEHLHDSAPRLAQPHQLHHPNTPRNQQTQTPTTPPNMKSHETRASMRFLSRCGPTVIPAVVSVMRSEFRSCGWLVWGLVVCFRVCVRLFRVVFLDGMGFCACVLQTSSD